VVGNSLIPFVAMICRGWFLFGCVAATPGFFLFLYYPVIHESPRWLITVGQGDRAIQIILKIARTNGKTVDPDVIDRMVQELVRKIKKDAENQNVGVWTLFSKYRIAKNTVMLILAWFVEYKVIKNFILVLFHRFLLLAKCFLFIYIFENKLCNLTNRVMNTLLYYGLTLNTTHMAGNKFLNYFFLSIIELPGGWLAGKLVEKTGRRWTQAAFFLLCTLSCLICAVAVAIPGNDTIVIIGALGIKSVHYSTHARHYFIKNPLQRKNKLCQTFIVIKASLSFLLVLI